MIDFNARPWYGWLSRCIVARGSSTGFSQVSYIKVKAVESFLFTDVGSYFSKCSFDTKIKGMVKLDQNTCREPSYVQGC